MRETEAGAAQSALRGAVSLAQELARLDQALLDLSVSQVSEVCLLRCDDPEQAQVLADRLTRRARRAGYLSSQVSFKESSLETLDDVVRLMIDELTPPTASGATHRKGLLSLLEGFRREHGDGALAEFDRAVREFGATDDLTALARALLAADPDSTREEREYTAWLSGTEMVRKSRLPIARSALTEKTAKKALSEITRLARVCGYKGCYFYFRDGDVVPKRPERRRQRAYTVLRELVDNFDTGRGAISTRFVIAGSEALFEGERSLRALAPLYARLQLPTDALPPPPHRSWAHVTDVTSRPHTPSVEEPTPSRRKKVSALVRISQGLPPLTGVAALSVNHEKIDALVTSMFEHASLDGSVFQVLTGEYGSGKTHLLMHLAERAHEQNRPVFRLNLEQLDFDLGNPQRHLWRLLRDSSLPRRHNPSALDRLAVWTRNRGKFAELCEVLTKIAGSGSDAAPAAQEALKLAELGKSPRAAVESFLSARDLMHKSGAAAHRRAAYRRFLLWLELLAALEDCAGPVLMIDEAENLYTTHVSDAARRAAVRSLSFYCGGVLPSACVILAITPKVFGELKRDARELLAEVSDQSAVLDWEDAEMLRRRLFRLIPEPVPAFTRKDRAALAERLIAMHRQVRGPLEDLEIDGEVRALVRDAGPPRALLRQLCDFLESAWWRARV